MLKRPDWFGAFLFWGSGIRVEGLCAPALLDVMIVPTQSVGTIKPGRNPTHKKPRDKRGVFQMLPGGHILPSNTKINRITRIVPMMPDGP